ncbi:MAG: PhzF family phenazine biosynthesis protein [Bacteroidota bacterium]
MKFRYYTCDVFTDRSFGGNQLAVFPDATKIPENVLQSIAKEFNFSETTFVYPPSNPKHTKRVRIFTPANELPFAGHPTIGTAITLATIGAVATNGIETKIILEEGVGDVPVTIRLEKGKPPFAQLSAARLPEFNHTVPSTKMLAKMLTVSQRDLDDDRFPIQFVSVGFPFLYVAVKNREALKKIRVNVQIMEELKVNEVFVFTDDTEQSGIHFRARMFAPLLGISEDPATGSAAASFAGYLAAIHPTQTGTLKWSIEQGVEMGRPSILFSEAEKKNGTVTSLRVGGNAVMVCEGEIEL